MRRFTLIILMFLPVGHTRAADIAISDALVIGPITRSGRALVAADPIEATRVAGTLRAPQAGDSVELRDGKRIAWLKVSADKDGFIAADALQGGYAFVTVQSDDERVMILDAAGHSTVFVNGEPRAGDPYEYGFVRLPVLLKKGTNELLFVVGRGRFRAKLVTPPHNDAPYVDLGDVTSPDFVKGRRESLPFAFVLVNATTQPVTKPAIISALSVRKVAREISYDGEATSLKDDSTGVEFRIRDLRQTRKITFVSDIDGSVQYYALNPASLDADARRALVLSLHGAGVEATNQADAYSPKPWCDIVCPTNRRPFGFDWEDWGRLDAIEVLDHATRTLEPDPSLVYLTGHSMGGHGTWQLGTLFPDRFAAIGPSAGWVSFSTYANATTQPATQPSSSVAQLLRRSNAASDTASLVRNYASRGVYVLHGTDDDNVPVDQARRMVALIEPFHHDFIFHEQPKAGHWWDHSDEPGADCVDWPEMFDFFARHRLPKSEQVREVEFITPNPSISSRFHWLTIEAQVRAMLPSSVKLRCDPQKRRIAGNTDNVARMTLDLVQIAPGEPVQFELDGQALQIAWPASGRAHLERVKELWRAIDGVHETLKSPDRFGPFKDAFRRRMIFVYGTQGTPDETAWALAKARFDAETFWVRGNGSVPVIPDTMFDPTDKPDRNIVVYGNADMVKIWPALLGECPIEMRRDRVKIGSRELAGDDLACLMIRPRTGSDRACVAVIGGTGIAGMRLTDRLPIFVSGVGLPDCIVLDGGSGLRAAGFFGNDWSVENGEFSFDDDAATR